MKRNNLVLILTFLVALVLRFLYFPDNVYFGFDQARDAYESQGIYKNFDLKIIGPSTAAQDLFHGPLYWYLIGPFYLLSGGDPTLPAAFLLFINALGVFLVYFLGKNLLDEKFGIFASILYAFSFEQTQYAMYFGNPAPAVLTIILFYLGWSLLIFKKDWRGIPLSLFSFGLSLQFEFFLIYLSAVFLLLSFVFWRQIKLFLDFKKILVYLGALTLPLSTFILAELKFGFRATNALYRGLKIGVGPGNMVKTVNSYFERQAREVHDNLFSFNRQIEVVISVFLITTLFYLIFKSRNDRKKLMFLLIWIFSSVFIYLFGIPSLYYSNIGVGVGIVFLASFLVYKIFLKNKFAALAVVILIVASNLSLVRTQDPKGVINDIYVQEGMLLGREKEIIDYLYEEAKGAAIVVSASTMPLYVNTTWAYLFGWYGVTKYGYLPYWAGTLAPGYPGSLPAWEEQVEDYQFFSIIEPTRGVRQAFIDKFLEEQKNFGEVVDQVILGDIWYSQLIVQKREKKNDAGYK